MALTSPTLPLYTVDEYAENLLAQRISMVSACGPVVCLRLAEICGARAGESRALAARNIGIDDVMRAVQQSNVNLPTGKLYGPSNLHRDNRAVS